MPQERINIVAIEGTIKTNPYYKAEANQTPFLIFDLWTQLEWLDRKTKKMVSRQYRHPCVAYGDYATEAKEEILKGSVIWLNGMLTGERKNNDGKVEYSQAIKLTSHRIITQETKQKVRVELEDSEYPSY